MREGGGRVVDVNEDTTITTFRGGVAHAHTVCPYTVLWVYVAPIRKEESTYPNRHFVSASLSFSEANVETPSSERATGRLVSRE
jgi:hypothetical protein